MRLSLFFLPLIPAAMLVSGCQTLYAPHLFPTGYVYHKEEFKSPTPGQSAQFSKYDRAVLGKEFEQSVRSATYDLLGRLTKRAGLPPYPVYVLPGVPQTGISLMLDNDLREALRKLGYDLSDTQEQSYIMTYKAELLNRANAADPNVELVISVLSATGWDARLLTSEVGQYYIEGAERFLSSSPFVNHVPTRVGTGGYQQLEQQSGEADRAPLSLND